MTYKTEITILLVAIAVIFVGMLLLSSIAIGGRRKEIVGRVVDYFNGFLKGWYYHISQIVNIFSGEKGKIKGVDRLSALIILLITISVILLVLSTYDLTSGVYKVPKHFFFL